MLTIYIFSIYLKWKQQNNNKKKTTSVTPSTEQATIVRYFKETLRITWPSFRASHSQ